MPRGITQSANNVTSTMKMTVKDLALSIFSPNLVMVLTASAFVGVSMSLWSYVVLPYSCLTLVLPLVWCRPIYEWQIVSFWNTLWSVAKLVELTSNYARTFGVTKRGEKKYCSSTGCLDIFRLRSSLKKGILLYVLHSRRSTGCKMSQMVKTRKALPDLLPAGSKQDLDQSKSQRI